MKQFIMTLVLAFSVSTFAANTETLEKKEVTREPAQTHTVKGHVRSNGTYVAPYIRSNPNGTTSDNIRPRR